MGRWKKVVWRERIENKESVRNLGVRIKMY